MERLQQELLNLPKGASVKWVGGTMPKVQGKKFPPKTMRDEGAGEAAPPSAVFERWAHRSLIQKFSSATRPPEQQLPLSLGSEAQSKRVAGKFDGNGVVRFEIDRGHDSGAHVLH